MGLRDKEKIRAAFRQAVSKSPVADEPFDKGVTLGGQPLTNRGLVEMTLASDSFFNEIERDVQRGVKTLDEFAQNFADVCFPLNMSAPSARRAFPAPGR